MSTQKRSFLHNTNLSDFSESNREQEVSRVGSSSDWSSVASDDERA